jgi:hypothetical protein
MPYPSKTDSTVTDTDAPDDHDHDVEVGGPSSIESDASSERERGFGMDDFHRKRSGETLHPLRHLRVWLRYPTATTRSLGPFVWARLQRGS